MKATKSVGILQKIKGEDGVWRFVTVRKSGSKYLWGDHPGTFFLEWREGTKRRRESVGSSPSEALEARRRKTHELVGKMVEGKGWVIEKPVEGEEGTPIKEAARVFLRHVGVHSPDKPQTVERYRSVLNHFDRLMRKLQFVEAVQRRHIDEYKAIRASDKTGGRSGGTRNERGTAL